MNEISIELKGHFLRLYQIALTDGEFSPLEWKLLYQFAADRDVPKEELDRMLLSPTSQIGIPKTQEKRIASLYDFCVMIWADGKVSPDELNLLKKYCQKYEFEEENIDQLAQFLLDEVENGVTLQQLLSKLNAI